MLRLRTDRSIALVMHSSPIAPVAVLASAEAQPDEGEIDGDPDAYCCKCEFHRLGAPGVKALDGNDLRDGLDGPEKAEGRVEAGLRGIGYDRHGVMLRYRDGLLQ